MIAGAALVLMLAATGISAPAASSAIRYEKLRALGIKADRAVLRGRVVSVRIRATRATSIRVAVVRRTTVQQSWRGVRVKKGTTTLTRRLKGTPRVTAGLRLRIIATRGARSARGS